jgi:hypothetical protein
MFNVGDKVICIDTSDLGGMLVKNKTYTVIYANEHFVEVAGINTMFSAQRFQVEKSLDELWLEWEKAEGFEVNRLIGSHRKLPPIPQCTCGAKHTSNPKHHVDWCDLVRTK